MYVEIFINKNWNINRYNITSEKEIRSIHVIRYNFTEWKHQRVYVIKSMKPTRKYIEKLFIVDHTFQNMLQYIGGFFHTVNQD